MVGQIQNTYTTYGFNSYSKNFCRACLTCAKHNPQGNMRPQRGKFPAPRHPFQIIHMDFIELNKSEGKKYCLVIIDAFSKWVEIFPANHADALTVAKALWDMFSLIWMVIGIHGCTINQQNTHHTIPEIWLPRNKTTLIFAPVCEKIKDYNYKYLTNNQRQTGWDTLVADPVGYDWSSYSAGHATYHRKIIKMVGQNTSYVTLTVNLTRQSLFPVGYNRQSNCWIFQLWGWSDGTDPRCNFKLCEINCTNNTVPQGPILSDAARSQGLVIVIF